ncbi:hypothetical protein H2202_001346 [Exophiala xenobiotica]|nr:hypothetical protein H2202_001346 [Exophiala xenobiotica]KAK5208833.1 hypothetical protein LTR41_005230 [Exophiala xenobiotica]KAK5324913.1 hypothetical protein LTR93_004388 [Exophiala xenobiotica]KAK5370242.1 hypothetical protein LTS13_006832 [Exophiala xenobiotica]KAK5397500.1 hypothetical protein LTR79_005013 [Exophiala xenobiotica]
MDVVAAAVSFAQLAGICIKLANDLVHKYHTYKSAGKDIEDIIVRIEGSWLRTEAQIGVLLKILNSIDHALLAYQYACLERLWRQLCLATIEVENLTESNLNTVNLGDLSLSIRPIKKARYVRLSKHLQKLVADLTLWRDEFDPSWYLIGRIADSNIDKLLQPEPHTQAPQDEISAVGAIRKAIQAATSDKGSPATIFRDADCVSDSKTQILHSRITASIFLPDGLAVLLDQTAFDEDTDRTQSMVQVRDLARLLSFSKPETLGLLECLGAIKIHDQRGAVSQYQFIFKIPPGLGNPSVLRTLIMGPASSLDARFRIARSLARSVMAVHSADLVHKNIHPETIVVFEDSSQSLPSSFLVGFERFRAAGAGTTLAGDNVWQRNLYRHPNRQGIRPEDTYIMQHDIYSLGVCLLELGLWTTFVTPTEPPQPGPRLDIGEQLVLAKREPIQAARSIKSILINMAKELLPTTMGLMYTEVVLSCLTCLDSGTSNMFADARDVYDADGIIVGVAFIEKILLRLEGIRL